MGYYCATKGDKESARVVVLVAVNFCHEIIVGLLAPMSNQLTRSVRQGIKRAHVQMGGQ